MANFKTHLLAASVVSTAAAGAASNTQLIDIMDGPWFVFLGTLGGLLPDIDSDNSKPVKMLFNALGLLGAAAVGSALQNKFPPDRLLVFCTVAYGIIRYPLFTVFALLTEHRGVFHSVLSAAFFALVTTCISYYLMQWDELHAWLNGLFIAIGYLVHLILDEIYSVDLANTRIKRSFGSALKLCSLQNIAASLLMSGCTIALYFIAPSPASLVNFWARV